MVFCHDVTPVAQPSPIINPGGDCFACATLSMVKHFWPTEAADMTVANAVDWWRNENGYVQNTMNVAGRILANLPAPFRLEVHTDPFVPYQRGEHQANEPWFWPNAYEQRTEAYLTAGYVGFASVKLHGAQRMLSDEIIPDGKPGAGKRYKTSADHNVLIDGRRDYWPDTGDSVRALQREIHIACSVKGGYWIPVSELLEMHGGMFIWWCRPSSY